jgi:drug/metabolite transporter (DMT)-like permease
MRIPKTTTWGVALALVTALISGVSVYLNGRIVGLFDDPTLLAAVRNGAVGVVLGLALLVSGGRVSVGALTGRQRLGLLVVGVIGGGVPFALFFNGLALSTSPAAALIHKTMFLWVAAIAVVALRERLGLAQIGALALLLVGTLALAPNASLGAGPGEAMILVATICWALEVVLVRRLLTGGVPGSLAAASRMLIGSLALFAIVGTTGGLTGLTAFGIEHWVAIAVTGALLTGYVATWYAALERAPATLVTSVLVLGAVVTTTLQALTAGRLPAAPALVGNGLLLAGGAVAVVAVRRIRGTPRVAPELAR